MQNTHMSQQQRAVLYSYSCASFILTEDAQTEAILACKCTTSGVIFFYIE